MGKRLKEHVTSGYIEAANRMRPKRARRKIVAYVESYDDVFFWRTVLARLENEQRYFEVMLPARNVLSRGKKSAIMSLMEKGAGKDMIACVDADYDYLMQRATNNSSLLLDNPYVFHSYVYAIENYQCYAESLHSVCVMVTMNDHALFDFVDFFRQFSEIIHPLFLWSIWAYRKGYHTEFSISDFNRVIDLGKMDIMNPEAALLHLQAKVKRQLKVLQHRYPKATGGLGQLAKELARLGVVPSNTYLYIQGHHLFNVVVAPLLTKVCNRLRTEREEEIHRTSLHKTQMYNELSCYENSLTDVETMLRRNMGYLACPQFLQLQEDMGRGVEDPEAPEETSPEANASSAANIAPAESGNRQPQPPVSSPSNSCG